ncbi:uncharacterized protein LOC113520777 isoform X2 [Galleria mellonella]|uniref:Uncharacterized protein LOC113520777 isoform X2 n=1 Tax=Galleria mellonella TaxID=7137 RepID=A0ABM3MQA6_GALME|nr:uncharacterized protein LOC113520777 isoform X2 [Galleria mellonella]
MSLFNLEIKLKENNINKHPWERFVKDVYCNKIKYAHNSANNPHYPKPKVKMPHADCVKFTIIGNRVTKEFNYCVHLIKGLHKYRWKHFDSPVIRGVTSVEWPTVWNDLKIAHGGLAYCLKSQVAVLMNDKFLGGENELKELIEKKYIYHFSLDYYKEGVTQFITFIKSSGRPCAYMHISINDKPIGTMIFMLYADIVPYTCENFLRLCKAKKGGYSGTPVHRIVKDCWIQCGGFGLKSSDLDCENFIIPHDRRGVICMTNDGRHVDCSTQFFVLLQPAPWMEHKYVAFGQLIDGDETLKKIESVPTSYESPKENIIIYKSGIFNMECQDSTINKGTKAYIQRHIEDLIAVGELLYEALMEKVFLEIELRMIAEEKIPVEDEVGEEIEDAVGNIRATKRFIRRKEDIEKQLSDNQRGTSVVSEPVHNDIEEICEYELEEFSYQHVSLEDAASIEVKPEKPFYFPLTDVPYPGEVDSTYDLKKFLKGDYCLESDLEHSAPKKYSAQKRISYPSKMFTLPNDAESESSESLDSEDEREIQKYLKQNMDRVSFAGEVIKGIAKGVTQLNDFENSKKSEVVTDEKLRRIRLQSADVRARNTQEKKVRIAPSAVGQPAPHATRRPTDFVRAADIVDSDTQVQRPSVLQRLYDDVTLTDDFGPTLKDYRPMSEMRQKSILLTYSPNCRIKSEDSRERYLRHSLTIEDDSIEHVLNLQHGKKVARKISSDYVKTIDQMEHKLENSIRSVEYAKTRPAMSVSEYQLKNQKYQEGLRASKVKVKTIRKGSEDRGQLYGLRLPGDTPLYSLSDD